MGKTEEQAGERGAGRQCVYLGSNSNLQILIVLLHQTEEQPEETAATREEVGKAEGVEGW